MAKGCHKTTNIIQKMPVSLENLLAKFLRYTLKTPL